MGEYMLTIRNRKDHSDAWPAERQRRFLKAYEAYIADLQRDGRLIASQPMVREGVVLTKNGADWSATPIAPEPDVQVGYYHVRARSLDDAIAIAKRNPEFEYSPTARVEVRPIKTREAETGYEYPVGSFTL